MRRLWGGGKKDRIEDQRAARRKGRRRQEGKGAETDAGAKSEIRREAKSQIRCVDCGETERRVALCRRWAVGSLLYSHS